MRHAHHSRRRGSCRTRLPRLTHWPSCWSHLPWLGLAWPHSHALSLGWGLLLIPAHCSSTSLSGPRRRCLGLLLELGSLSCGPVHLRTLTTLSSWTCWAPSGALSTARAATRPGGACLNKGHITDLPTSLQMQQKLRLRSVIVNISNIISTRIDLYSGFTVLIQGLLQWNSLLVDFVTEIVT